MNLPPVQISEANETFDPRVVRTRVLLEQAFMQLMQSKDLSAITVRDITDTAGINRATFYAHFTDKYDLFTHIIRNWFNTSVSSQLPTSAPLDRPHLKQLALLVFNFMSGLDAGCHTPAREQFRPLVETEVQKQLYTFVHIWMSEQKGIAWEGPIDVKAAVVSWALYGVGLQFNREGYPQQAAELAEQVLDQLLSGLNEL